MENQFMDSGVQTTHAVQPMIDIRQSEPIVMQPVAEQAAQNESGLFSVADLFIIALLVAALAFILFYVGKVAKRAKRQIDGIDGRTDMALSEMKDEIASLRSQIATGSPRQSVRYEQPVKGVKTVTLANRESKKKSVSHEIRYASMQAPDGNGILRISERSMTTVSSQQKMFELELDMEAGTGVYRVNMDAKPLILQDLLMFKAFVKPFTFSGDVHRATIKNVKDGRIVRQDGFWVVEEPLEVKID